MNILFVCTANVCRSPLAEGYLRLLVRSRNLAGTEAGSAGISAMKGSPPFECAVEVARQFGFDISGKRAEQITVEMVRNADFVLCMETWQAGAVMQLAPNSSARIALLGAYHPRGQSLFQIRDPEAFRVPETLKVFELIRQSVDGFLDSVL